MTDAAFLDALAADPTDDVTRAVYADWLEEHGDGRAGFLRAEIALAARPDGDAGWCDAAASVPRDGIDDAWASKVGPRYDVWLMGYEPTRKISCIKVIRELTGLGLYEALQVVNSVPARVIAAVPSGPGLCGSAALFRAADQPDSVVVRRAGQATPDLHPGWPAHPSAPHPPGSWSLWLVAYPPTHKIPLIRAIREHTALGLAQVKALVERTLPVCLHTGLWTDQILSLQVAYSQWATVEVTSAGTGGPTPAS